MVRLRIPDMHKSGFSAVFSFDDELIDKLRSKLESIEPTLDFAELLSRINRKIDDPAVPDVVAEVLLTLYWVRARSDISVDKFIDALYLAILECDDSDLQPIRENEKIFKEKLSKLLSVTSIVNVSKASDLQTEHKNVFLDSRLLTDIRPVFEEDPKAPTVGAVLTHTLKICYDFEGQNKEFFVVMDNRDVKKMMDCLHRSEQKTGTLEMVLKSVEKLRLFEQPQ